MRNIIGKITGHLEVQGTTIHMVREKMDNHQSFILFDSLVSLLSPGIHRIRFL